MHPHTKFEIPTSNNIRDMLRTRLFQKLGQRSRSRSRDPKRYATLRHPKMYPHTKFGIPTSKNVGDRLRTRSRTDRRTVQLLYASQSSFGGIKISINSITHSLKDFLTLSNVFQRLKITHYPSIICSNNSV